MEEQTLIEQETLTVKEVKQLNDYTARLEANVVSLLNTVDQLEKELYFVVRKNMQLENQEDAVTLALIKNPLNMRKEFRV